MASAAVVGATVVGATMVGAAAVGQAPSVLASSENAWSRIDTANCVQPDGTLTAHPPVAL